MVEVSDFIKKTRNQKRPWQTFCTSEARKPFDKVFSDGSVFFLCETIFMLRMLRVFLHELGAEGEQLRVFQSDGCALL